MSYRPAIHLPPRNTNYDGATRKVGVEIEFGGLSAEVAAQLVQKLFGGRIDKAGIYRFYIRETALGDFRAELDTQYVHMLSDESNGIERLKQQVRNLYGEISSYILPCEIVCPPVPIADILALERIVEALRSAGAEGTGASPLYAFSMQLNPDIATRDPAWIAAILKAYLLASDWLQTVIDVDVTRQLIGFAAPFPSSYINKVVDPSYWPDLKSLMDDYLDDNPTRDRGVDMLPLFGWVDEPRLRMRVSDVRVRPRPTFHYRLPDSHVDDARWCLALEWNRWCAVERLAENRDALNAMGAAYLANDALLISENWAMLSSDWLVQTCP